MPFLSLDIYSCWRSFLIDPAMKPCFLFFWLLFSHNRSISGGAQHKTVSRCCRSPNKPECHPIWTGQTEGKAHPWSCTLEKKIFFKKNIAPGIMKESPLDQVGLEILYADELILNFSFAFPTHCGTEYYADISCHVPERAEKPGAPVPTSPCHPNAGPHDLEPYAQWVSTGGRCSL